MQRIVFDAWQGMTLAPRKNLSPLLLKLSERKPERLHYLGVSFGVTEQLFKFWKNAGYIPVYLRQTAVRLFSSL
jgi:N-acetyltransferase 10